MIPRPHAAWYTEELREAKRLRMKLERTWCNGNQERDRQNYRRQYSVVATMLHQTKTAYYSSKVEHCKKDNKALFKITDTLLKPSNKVLPQIDNINSLPSQFLDFFENKIQTEKIRENCVPELQINTHQHNITPLCVLRPATTLKLRTIIMNSPSKSCELDPMPTWLLKKCIDEILPSIVRLVNTSLRSGRFLDSFKEAVIRPLRKKSHLDTDDLKNYRLVSNLQFLKKIEKIVMACLEEHIVDNNLHDRSQSAYKKCHSTDTALL